MTATIQTMLKMGFSEDVCKKARNIASFTNSSMRKQEHTIETSNTYEENYETEMDLER